MTLWEPEQKRRKDENNKNKMFSFEKERSKCAGEGRSILGLKTSSANTDDKSNTDENADRKDGSDAEVDNCAM